MRGRLSEGADIDLGLKISESVQIELDEDNKPCAFTWGTGMTWGETRTIREIAAFCGCKPQRISQLEQQALRKLRNRFQFTSDPILKEIVATLMTS